MSGIEIMRAIGERKLPPPPVASLIGVSNFKVEKGKSAVDFEPAEFHYNALGAVHGGVIATVLDIVLGSAAQSLLKVGQGFTTLTLELKYHRAATANSGVLTATAEIVTRGREIMTGEAQLVDAKGRLFAKATSTLMTLRTQPAA